MNKSLLSCLIWILVTGLLALFENGAAARALFVMAMLLPALSALACALCARHAKVSLDAPAQIQAGQTVSISISVTAFPFIPGLIRAGVQADNLLTGESVRANADRDKGGMGEFLLNNRYSGLLAVTARVTFRDLLGREHGPLNAVAHTLAVPTWTPFYLPEPMDAAPDGGDLSAPSILRYGEELSEVREYVPGDPVKRIHWKLSQKTGKLLVREAEASRPDEWTIALDASPVSMASPDRPALMDALVKAAFALSEGLLHRGVPHTLLWRPDKEELPAVQHVSSREDLLSGLNRLLSVPLSAYAPLPEEGTEVRTNRLILVCGGVPADIPGDTDILVCPERPEREDLAFFPLFTVGQENADG